MMNFRIGTGYDVHKLIKGTDIRLGGIDIPNDLTCDAHSDGDVLIHAICDSLLGAANLRDIGFNFPDNDNQYKNIDSRILLKKTVDKLRNNNFEIANIDSTIVLQKPKISEFIPSMQEELGKTMNISPEQISIKATTTEGLGFEGTLQGISAKAIALIYSV